MDLFTAMRAAEFVLLDGRLVTEVYDFGNNPKEFVVEVGSSPSERVNFVHQEVQTTGGEIRVSSRSGWERTINLLGHINGTDLLAGRITK